MGYRVLLFGGKLRERPCMAIRHKQRIVAESAGARFGMRYRPITAPRNHMLPSVRVYERHAAGEMRTAVANAIKVLQEQRIVRLGI